MAMNKGTFTGGGNPIWKKIDGIISPKTPGDNVDMLTGGIKSSFYVYNKDYTPTGLEPPGTRYWDSVKRTTSLVLEDGSILQDGQELQTPVFNDTGVKLLNGQVVRLSGQEGPIDTVILYSALDDENAYGVIGFMTTDAEIEGFGYVVKHGDLNDIDTSLCEPNTPVYASNIAGEWTETIPEPPSMPVLLGFVKVKDDTIGSISVNPIVLPAIRATKVAKDPTGFFQPENVIVTYDKVTRKITLTGFVQAYWLGQHIHELDVGWASEAHDDIEGAWFLYYDGTNYIWSQTIWKFTQLMIAYTYYATVHKFGIRETHGTLNHPSHKIFHDVVGTRRISGGTLADYTILSTTPAERRPTVSTCVIDDEELQTTNPALSDGLYTHMELTGAGIVDFGIDQSDIVNLLIETPFWNEFNGATWQQSLMPANTVQSVWLYAVPVTADDGSQKYRYLWLQGQWYTQAQNSSAGKLLQALNIELLRTQGELNLGNLEAIATEFVAIARVTVTHVSSNFYISSVSVLLGSKFSQSQAPAGNFLSIVETDATLIGYGTVGSPLGVLDNMHLHTIDNVTGLQNALNDKINTSEIGVSVQPYNADTVIDGAYVHTDNNYTTTEKNKLLGIEPLAEVNQTDAQIKSQYEANSNTNAFTDAEKAKLASSESSKFLGEYISLSALETAHPSPSTGSYGNVDLGIGQDVVRYIWDDDDLKYVLQLGESTILTNAQIKTQYEANPDTNAYTDAEKQKVSQISVTQPVDLDAVESDTSSNNAHRTTTTGNPHNVTKTDVGLGNVDNTSDLAKPISTATQTAIDGKVSISGDDTIDGIKSFSNKIRVDNITEYTPTNGVIIETTLFNSFGATIIGDLNNSGVRVVKGWFVSAEFTNMPTVSGTSINANGVLSLASGEVSQLANINSNTISNTQWGYVGGMDQSVDKGSTTEFVKIELKNQVKSLPQNALFVLKSTDESNRFELTIGRTAAGAGSYFKFDVVEQNISFRDIILAATGGSIGVGGLATVDASAILDVRSTTKGLAVPRMTTTEREAISNPIASLIIYNTTDNKHQGYDGSSWSDFY